MQELDYYAKIICELFCITEKQLFEKTKKRYVTDLRAVFYKVCKENTKLSYAEIAAYKLFRTHATALYAIYKIDEIPELKAKYDLVVRYIKERENGITRKHQTTEKNI